MEPVGAKQFVLGVTIILTASLIRKCAYIGLNLYKKKIIAT